MENDRIPEAGELYNMVRKGDAGSASYARRIFEAIGLHPKIAEYVSKQLVEALKKTPEDKAQEIWNDAKDRAYRIALVNGLYDGINTEDAAKWLRRETRCILKSIQAMWEDAQDKLAKLPGTPVTIENNGTKTTVALEPGEEDENLVPAYVSAMDAFNKARQSRHMEESTPGSKTPFKEILGDIANTTYFGLFNPAVAHYGRALLVYRLRKKPEIFDTEKGYEWFQAMVSALEYLSDRIESDKLEYKIEFYRRLVEKRRGKADKNRGVVNGT